MALARAGRSYSSLAREFEPSIQTIRKWVEWVADATYVPTGEGVLYLAIVLDVFARRIVGWSMAARQDSELMVCALQMALSRRQPRQVIHHSDQGSQYTSKHFLETCKNANVQVSTGSVVIVMTTRCPRVSLLR